MDRKTTPTQVILSSYELETLAIIDRVKKFQNYLSGTKLKIVTCCSEFQKTRTKKALHQKWPDGHYSYKNLIMKLLTNEKIDETCRRNE